MGWWAESDGSTIRVYNDQEQEYEYKYFPKGTLFRIQEFYGWNGRANEGCHYTSSKVSRIIKKAESNFPYEVHPLT